MKQQVFLGPGSRLNNIIKYIIKATVTIKNDGTNEITVDSAFFVVNGDKLVDCSANVNYIRANVLTNESGDQHVESVAVYISSKNVTNITLLTLSVISEDDLVSSSDEEYATLEEIQTYIDSRLSNYATTSDLSNYVTSTELSNYVTNSDLSNYVTSSELSNYATTSDLSNYATTSALNSLSATVTTHTSDIQNLTNGLADQAEEITVLQDDVSKVETSVLSLSEELRTRLDEIEAVLATLS